MPQEIRFSAPDITDAEVAAATRALMSGWITTGEECLSLERELTEYLGVEHVVAVSSCTAALEISVARLGLPRGSKIGVPTWTFVSSALAPYHRGVMPVPLDIDEDTFNLSADALRRSIAEDGLDAVIAVHFGGTPFGEDIHQICNEAGIPLIEDAAHALGARDHRGMVAGQGTAGCCYSFYATKNLTSAEGGALATDDEELAAFAQSFRLHGLSRDAWARYTPGAKTAAYDILGDGLKANLPDILAAIARAQLDRFEGLQERRRELDGLYRQLLADIPDLRLVPSQPDEGSANHLMMVTLPEGTDRAGVQKHLSSEGIGSSVHFRPLHAFEWFAANDLRSGSGGTPVADRYVERALSLPFHTCLGDDDVERVCEQLQLALKV
ncbi:MAG: DegT/DnrJ/EryC1/StrS family aminotransferase [Microthrixaceae bacterium]